MRLRYICSMSLCVSLAGTRRCDPLSYDYEKAQRHGKNYTSLRNR